MPPAPITRLPNLGRVDMTPHFSAAPNEAEIFAAHVFPQALVPVGVPMPGENKALADALLQYWERSDAEDCSAVLGFLKTYPNSAWKSSLLLNLGIVWRQTGYFSRAMDAWKTVWDTTKNETDPKSKAIADRAIGELLQINAWVGRYEVLEPLLAEVSDRKLIGGASEMLTGAKEGLWIMNHRPEKGFMCGPLALRQVALATKEKPDLTALIASESTTNGFFLTQVNELAAGTGLKYQMAKRQPGSPIPTNSVVHWKLNHYSAILQEDRGRYLIQDTTLNQAFGRQLWISQAALDEEASGYFLIPEGPLPRGWQSVGPEEGGSVWGRGTGTGKDQTAYTPNDCKICPNNDGMVDGIDGSGANFASQAMARASAHLMLVSLNIADTPVGYHPPRGPSVGFTLVYNQRDASSLPNTYFSNLGSKWTFGWFTYISDVGPNDPRTTVTRYVSGGGYITHESFNSVTATYAADRDGNVLQYVPAPSGSSADSYVMTLPDGTVNIFGQPSASYGPTGPKYYPRQMLLTQVIDPQGNAVTINYDNLCRIAYINDALGQSTIFHYDLTSPVGQYLITRIEDPFHRIASFEYNQNGLLMRSTDVSGMTSAFSYTPGVSDFISQMTTPYGVSTFSYTESGTTRTLLMTDPNGDRQYVAYGDTANTFSSTSPFPPSDSDINAPPTGAMETTDFQTRNTFYFDENAMAHESTPLDPTLCTIYHWMGDNEVAGQVLATGLLGSLKPPLESRIYYAYPNQTTRYSPGVSLRMPSSIARMVESPGNPNSQSSQHYSIGYNYRGHPTAVFDPVNRAQFTQYAIENNSAAISDIDVQSIRQVGGGKFNGYLAQFAEYGVTALHRPNIYIDQAGQTYGLAWNSTHGQITHVTDPNGNVTDFNYDSGGNYLINIVQHWGSGGTKMTSFLYDGYGRLSTVTDSEGYTVTYNYDLLDRVVKITYPDTTTERFIYNRLDLIYSWDRAGNPTWATYDHVGRPLTVQDRIGRVTQYTWCGCGSLESITDPLGHATSWTHDIEGRVTAKVFADNSQIHYGFESYSGRLSYITDAKSQTKTYSYNTDDSLAGIAYSGSIGVPTPNVSFTYDTEFPRLSAMTDGNGTTLFSYYPIITDHQIFINNQLVFYSATPGAGQLQTVTGPNNNYNITYHYDLLGRVASRSIGGLTDSVGPGTGGSGYDALGRITEHDTPLGTFNRTYLDATFRPQTIQYPNGQSTQFSWLDNTHDQRLGGIQNLTSGSATISQFGYTYDKLGRIIEWSRSQDPLDTAAYTDDLDLRYDNEGQLSNAVAWAWSTQLNMLVPTNGYAYDYDPAGNRTSEQQEPPYWTPPPIANATVVSVSGYNNNINQLTGRNTTSLGNPPIHVQALLSQAADQSTVKVAVDGQAAQSAHLSPNPGWSSPPGNAVLDASASIGTGFGYGGYYHNFSVQAGSSSANYTLPVALDMPKLPQFDANGNCTQDTAIGETTVTYGWDAEDRLAKITDTGQNFATQITYDGFGRRVSMVEQDNSGTVLKTSSFVWDGMELLQCTEVMGTETRVKTYYPEGMYLQDTINGTTTTKSYFYARDHLGSIREMTDANQNIVARYTYDPYGRVSQNVGSNTNGVPLLDADFRFAGMYFHTNSHLHLTLFRAYDADTGRWLSRDPMGEAGGMNLYGYSGNGPINWIDSFGLSVFQVDFIGPLQSGDSYDPLLSLDNRVPPGYNSTWLKGADNRSVFTQDPISGRKFYPHPSDRRHWDHYDWKDPDGRIGRYPEKCEKERPGQQRAPYGDQSATDPWSKRMLPLNDPTTQSTFSVIFTPGVPGMSTYPIVVSEEGDPVFWLDFAFGL
jgi:RHS repeat-associated protein